MSDAITEPAADPRPATGDKPPPITLLALLHACRTPAFADQADPAKLERAFCTFFVPVLDHPVLALTPAAISRLITAGLLAGLEPHTINIRLYALRALMREGVQAGLLVEDPLKDLQTLHSQPPRNRLLTPAERAHLWQALYAEEQFLRSFAVTATAWSRTAAREGAGLAVDTAFASPLTPKVMFSLATGITRGHSDRLTWSAVDLTHATMTVPTRLGAPLSIPLHEAVVDLLLRWRCQSTGKLVFPERLPALRRVSVRASWDHLMAAVPVPGLRWADFRTDFGNRLVERGAPHDHVRYLMACCPRADAGRTVDDAYFQALRDTLAMRVAECPLNLQSLARFAHSQAAADSDGQTMS